MARRKKELEKPACSTASGFIFRSLSEKKKDVKCHVEWRERQGGRAGRAGTTRPQALCRRRRRPQLGRRGRAYLTLDTNCNSLILACDIYPDGGPGPGSRSSFGQPEKARRFLGQEMAGAHREEGNGFAQVQYLCPVAQTAR